MPAPGEQHKSILGIGNPFEEVPHRMSEYTAQEIAILSSRLEKQLGPEYISSRAGPSGHKVHYLAAEKCINLANEVFGFNGWSSAIRDVQIDFVDENPTTGKISLGLSVIVRVTLKDGAYHEDIGYGQIENCKGKAMAFEKAKKEGTTDGLKRALRNFGNVLGNCVYDKDYLSRITKVKVAPSKWDAENLHRHSDYAPIKKEPVDDVEKNDHATSDRSNTEDDEFGVPEFDEADLNVNNNGHPDEMVLDQPRDLPRTINHPPAQRQAVPPQVQNGRPQPPRTHPMSINNSQSPLANRGQQTNFPNALNHPQGLMQRAPPMQTPTRQVSSTTTGPPGPYPNPQGQQAHTRNPNPAPPAKPYTSLPNQGRPSPESDDPPIDNDAPVGFFSARAAEAVQNGTSIPAAIPHFNPASESPSIPRTSGIDHTKTKAIARAVISTLPPTKPSPTTNARPTNFVNPAADPTRKIGMPNAGMQSPMMQNRNQYKPPMKRAADGTVSGGNGPPLGGSILAANPQRPVLNDVTNTTANTNVPPESEGGDSKRQRVENTAIMGPAPTRNTNVT